MANPLIFRINRNRELLFILSFLFTVFSYSQDRRSKIDSIEAVYKSGKLSIQKELEILEHLSKELQDPQKKLDYSEKLIQKAQALDSVFLMYGGYLQKGNAYRLKSDLTKALEAFLEAAKIAEKHKKEREIALTNITIGDVYSVMGNHDNSVAYYNKGIEELRKVKTDSINLASALLNAGDEYFNAEKYDKAMTLFYESSLICKKINFRLGSAYNLGNIGMVYAKQEKPELAEANISEAIQILEEEEDYHAISVYLEYVADIYLNQNKVDFALNYATKSLELSKKYGLKDQISNACLKLSQLYQAINNSRESLVYYKEYVAYKDSVSNIASVQKLADLRTEFEVSKKQNDIDLLNEQKRTQRIITYAILIFLALVILLAFGLFRRNKYINKTKVIIENEKKRSDDLLRNILPDETADELKLNGKVEAKKFEAVTVLFTDFKGFTKYAEELPPEELVKTVDMYFSKFDSIMEKYNLEKIKTIGDAYMCAGGLPEPTKDHAEKVVLAAFEILEFVNDSKLKHSVNEARFDIRIGVHTGPIVAGVVGSKKFSYDIWGDTVNIASRMESASEAGKINISGDTKERIDGLFNFENRGEIAIKNRASMPMYFVSKK